MGVAQNILVRGITAGRAGVAAFAAEAVKLAQAEGYRSLKATEAGPLPAGMSDPFTLCIRLGKDSNLKRTSGNRRYPSSA